MIEKLENMSFADLYAALGRIQAQIRDEICAKLGISPKTFYNKINDDSFSNAEKHLIANVLNKSESQLFPHQKATA